MPTIRATTAGALFALLGELDPAYAQAGPEKDQQGVQRPANPQSHGQQQKPEARGRQEQRQAPQAKPQARQQQQSQRPQVQQQRSRPPERQDRLSQQARQSPSMRRSQQQAMTWQQQRGWARQGGWQGHSTWQLGRAQRWQTEHRTWVQRGGYGGYYIPQDRFRLSFGSQHYFRIQGRPVMYMGYPRFSYGGFSFLLVDPWPEYWEESWYQDDDVYIDYHDGYYLNNRRYPSVRLAITVVL